LAQFSGRIALVTGSMSGIGLAIAERLSAEGATVVLNSRTSPKSPVRLPGSNADALHVAGDVWLEADVSRMVHLVEERYGALDILVNNAGTTIFVDHDDLLGVSTEDWNRILGVNVVGAWNTIRAAEKLLRSSPLGAVINITSIAGIRPSGSSIPYAVSKAALNHLTALLARALGPDIRVNGIAPGFIQTPWTRDYTDRRVQIERDSPLRRVGLPEEIAEVCISLIRADYITGQIITVDGGVSLL
jgi:ketoreductase RED2